MSLGLQLSFHGIYFGRGWTRLFEAQGRFGYRREFNLKSYERDNSKLWEDRICSPVKATW
jgi:hypothetical protein